MYLAILILYIVSLTVILFYSFNSFYLFTLYRKARKSKQPQPSAFNDKPFITIQLPVYNEKFVVERLIESVCNIEYDKSLFEIQVLDDSTDETTQIIAQKIFLKIKEGFQIQHIRRLHRTGFKAGALDNGMKTSKGDFIVIFDSDFIPGKDFLKITLPYFSDDRIGVVQAGWSHQNENSSLLTQVQAFALNGHFVTEQIARHASGYMINFNGTAGVLRKQCIQDAGGWLSDTLTEDLDLSYRAQLKGWRFIYLPHYSVPAELPVEINALKAQQFRWTKGSIQTCLKLLPSVFKSTKSVSQKIQGFFHLTINFIFPFILLLVLLNPIIVFEQSIGLYSEVFQLMSVFGLAFINTFLFYFFSQNYSGFKRILLFPVFLAGSMGMAFNNSRAVFQALAAKQSDFLRTPKYHSVIGNMRNFIYSRVDTGTVIEVILSIYCLLGVIFTIYLKEYVALPFQLMFFVGFSIISVLSLRQNFLIKRSSLNA